MVSFSGLYGGLGDLLQDLVWFYVFVVYRI